MNGYDMSEDMLSAASNADPTGKIHSAIITEEKMVPQKIVEVTKKPLGDCTCLELLQRIHEDQALMMLLKNFDAYPIAQQLRIAGTMCMSMMPETGLRAYAKIVEQHQLELSLLVHQPEGQRDMVDMFAARSEWAERCAAMLQVLGSTVTLEQAETLIENFINSSADFTEKIAVVEKCLAHVADPPVSNLIITKYREPHIILRVHIQNLLNNLYLYYRNLSEYESMLNVLEITLREQISIDPTADLVALLDMPVEPNKDQFKAADLLLHQAWTSKVQTQIRTQARQFLLDNAHNKNLYENSMNIHTSEVENSVVGALGCLMSKIAIIPPDYLDRDGHFKFDEAEAVITTINDDKKILVSMARIANDPVVYYPYNITLAGVFSRCYVFIMHQKPEDRDQLLLRLSQELSDMADTCTSGYFIRLLNTFSGFVEGMDVGFGFTDELTASIMWDYNIFAANYEDAYESGKKDIIASGQQANGSRSEFLMAFYQKFIPKECDVQKEKYKAKFAEPGFENKFMCIYRQIVDKIC